MPYKRLKPFQRVPSSQNKPPSPRQKRFVDEYLIDLNSTAAAERAGFSIKDRSTPSRLMALPWVKKAIAERMKDRAARVEVGQDQIIEALARVAFGDPRKLYDENGNLKPIHKLDDATVAMIAGLEVDTVRGQGNDSGVLTTTAKIKRDDKLRAIELLGKHLGMFKDRVEHTGSVAFIIER